jgi:3-hydroxypropionyl-CoA synthetase (ADP-forming)
MPFYTDTVNTTRISKRKRVKNKMNFISKQDDVRNILEQDMKVSASSKIVTEEIAKQILSEYSVKVPKFILVKDVVDAAKKAFEIGFPLVAKVVSDEVLHKTDVQGVKLGLSCEEEVKLAFTDLYDRLSNRYNVKGVILEKMVRPGIELIVGLQNNPQVGPVIMVGFGGIYTEIIKDVTFRVLPITKNDAIEMIEDLRGKQLLQGFRGSEPIDIEILCNLLVDIGKYGVEMAPYYESIDLNPVIVYPKDYSVVDVKMKLRENPKFDVLSTAQTDLSYIDSFFSAKSIALIGASPEEYTVGNSVLRSLVRGHYRGKVFPVNAKGYSEIMHIKAYKSIEEITEPVELVLVTSDIKLVPGILESCGRKNVHNMIVFSGGGKEMGAEGATIEDKIRKLASELKIRIIGPNCVGIFNNENYLDCIFQGYNRSVRPKKGHVAFISQSGTMAAAFMESCSYSLGLSKLISYGNRLDVDEADMITYLSNDPKTRVIGIYLEGVADGRKFINAAKKVIKERKIPIVVFKNSRTTKAAKQSVLHNGSLGSSYDIIKCALEQAGIISVDSYEELCGCLKALSWSTKPKGKRVAMVTNGGAAVVAALDHIERLGLELAEISDKTKKAFKEYYPPTYVTGNPCDLTCVATAHDYKFAIQLLMDDPNVDIIMSWFVPWFVFRQPIADMLAELQRQNKKPLLVGTMERSPFTSKITSRLEDQNVPVYHSVVTWITAAAALAKWSFNLAQDSESHALMINTHPVPSVMTN